jgi:hypothetical protein
MKVQQLRREIVFGTSCWKGRTIWIADAPRSRRKALLVANAPQTGGSHGRITPEQSSVVRGFSFWHQSCDCRSRPGTTRLQLARRQVRERFIDILHAVRTRTAHSGLRPPRPHRTGGVNSARCRRFLLYSGRRRIIRANWVIAVTSWYTIPAKNGQNAASNTTLYNCKSRVAIPKAPNR